MAKAKRAVEDAPDDAVFVSVYCAGSRSDPGLHPEKPWYIVTFVLSDDEDFPQQYWADGTPRWTELRNEYITQERRSIRLDTASTRTTLVDDTPVSPQDIKANPAILNDGSRSQYNLRCRTCKASLPIKDQPLHRALTFLNEHGVVETPLLAVRETDRLLRKEARLRH